MTIRLIEHIDTNFSVPRLGMLGKRASLVLPNLAKDGGPRYEVRGTKPLS